VPPTFAGFGPRTPEGIVQVTVDLARGEVLSERRNLWSGTGATFPEAPHLYRVGSWWSLLIAEGGAEGGHAVSFARGSSPEWHVLGRETYADDVTWSDGWPTFGRHQRPAAAPPADAAREPAPRSPRTRVPRGVWRYGSTPRTRSPWSARLAWRARSSPSARSALCAA